jgi:ABC-type Fe3+ transport system permease subunit
MTRAIGLVLAAPLAGFALEAALGAGQFQLHLRAWGQTLIVAGGATALALVLGVPAALRWPTRAARLLRTLTLFPLLLPPVLAAAAWLGAGCPRRGVRLRGDPRRDLLARGRAAASRASLRRIPADALDAAALQLTPARTARVVVWPHVRPALGAAALLVFLLAASEFTFPRSSSSRRSR